MSMTITTAPAQQSAESIEQQMMLFADMLHQMQMSTPSDTQSTAERILVDLRRSESAQQSINDILGDRICVNEKSLIGLAGQLADSEKLRAQEKLEVVALKQLVQDLLNENASLSQKLIASERERIVESQRVQEQFAQLKESFQGEIALKDQAYASKFNLIDQRMENAEGLSGRMDESLQQLKTEVAAHESVKNQKLGGLSQQIADLTRELASHVTAVNARIDSTLALSEEVGNSTAASLEQVHTQHVELQNGIDARFNETANTCAILSSRIESSAVELQALKNASADTEASLKGLSALHFNLEANVGGQIESLNSGIGQVNQARYGDIVALNTRVDGVLNVHNGLRQDFNLHNHKYGHPKRPKVTQGPSV